MIYYNWNCYVFSLGGEDPYNRYHVFNEFNDNIADYLWSNEKYSKFHYFIQTYGSKIVKEI